MPLYSHSQLATFEQCPLKYRFRYVDRIRKPQEQGAEAFTGSMVHQALEKLYYDLEYEKLNSLDELLAWYNDQWRKQWRPEIKIVREGLTGENYRERGARCIRTYYERYTPFRQSQTIGTEMRLVFSLDDAGQYRFQGYIDRLARRADGTYEIHDYKTGGHLPSQAEADRDRQLALYQAGLESRWPDAERVDLIWHYVGCGQTLVSHRNQDQLLAAREAAMGVIDRINATTDFAPVKSRLCDWCEYKPDCPLWKHVVAAGAMPADDFDRDDGVKLADEFARTRQESERLERRLDELRENILAFSHQHDARVLQGHGVRVSVSEREQLALPPQDDPALKEAESFVRSIGKWDELSALSASRVTAALRSTSLLPAWRDRLRRFLRSRSVATLRVKTTGARDDEED